MQSLRTLTYHGTVITTTYLLHPSPSPFTFAIPVSITVLLNVAQRFSPSYSASVDGWIIFPDLDRGWGEDFTRGEKFNNTRTLVSLLFHFELEYSPFLSISTCTNLLFATSRSLSLVKVGKIFEISFFRFNIHLIPIEIDRWYNNLLIDSLIVYISFPFSLREYNYSSRRGSLNSPSLVVLFLLISVGYGV